MIVNTHKRGWEVIHQRAHGLLAVKVASHWRHDQRPERWIETLLAIAEHDDGQEEWQNRNHLNESGAPLDFMLKPFNMVQLERVTEMSQHKGRWIALLISMHMSFLYEEKRGEGKDIDTFLDLQKSNQQKWFKQLKITTKEANHAYAIMQWCDRFSLILCRNELPAGERALEVTKGPDGKRYEVIQKADEIVTVNPWPFQEDIFTLSIEATALSQLSFENDQQLLETLRQSPITDKTWLLKKNA
jgi:hypothetical protein